MSNFKFLLSDPAFVPFADVAMAAEKILHIDPAACILNCRRAMEFAVKWMYSVDKELEMPYQDNLQSLMTREEFRQIVGNDLWQRMDFIRKKGNTAAHNTGKITEAVAMLCLENLHIFLDFVAYCYAETYEETKFDPQIVHNVGEASRLPRGTGDPSPTDMDLAALIEENKALKEQLTARREEQQQTYVPKPLDISEYETRKFYIDAMLEDAGWVEGKDWINEVELPGMPNRSEVGFADYVLYDDAHKPLAVIEAKRTCVDVSSGRQQASLYADILEKKYKRRPAIFLTNGFETHILDGQYPERKCACLYSKAKFWQMIGRGTRLCPGLRDGADKDKFYIFDFCGNFAFFRMNNGKPTALQIALQGAVFSLKAQIAYKLQDIAYQTPELIAFRKTLVDDMVRKVQELNKENFAVRQHLKFVELYSNPEHYTALTYENTLQMRDELAPLITPDADEASAVRFDALMYGIELAFLMGKKYAKARTDLIKKVSGIASVANIPEIMVQSELIHKILHTDYLENAGIHEFEHIRENLRDLIKYIPRDRTTYITNFADELISMDWKESELENDDLKNYKMKAEFYIRQNQDNAVIAKLKSNQPLTSADVEVLEGILWSEVGTKQDYENAYGSKPLGEFVREIVGLDMNAAKEAFAQYLNDASLDSNQIYFVNQIVEYIVHNGLMKDLSVLQDAPFTDNGSIVEVFTDLSVWVGIKKVIDQINANAIAA